MTALRHGFLYFIIVFAAGFVLGVVRVLVLVPMLGTFTAVLVEFPVILSLAWLACGRILRGGRPDRQQAALMGATAFVLLMLAEASLSLAIGNRTLTDHIGLYGEPEHQLGLSAQVAFAVFPWIHASSRSQPLHR